MAGENSERKLDKALREIAALRRELRELAGLINADVRTADRLIGVREAGELLGKKKTAIYDMIRRGDLPARRIGGGRYKMSYLQVQKLISAGV